MKKLFLVLSLFFGISLMSNAKVALLVPAGNTDMNSMQYEHYITNDEGVPVQHEQSPERRVWSWFNEWFVASNEGQFICFNDLANLPSDIHTIWIYVDRVDFGVDAFDALFANHISELQAFVNNGGNLFLCKQATRLEKDLVGATMANGEVIVPDYNDGGYIDAATWGVDYYFFDGEGWGTNVGHPMYSLAPHKDDTYAELIWSGGGRITDHNCGIGIGAMDMSDVNDADGLATFQNRNNCKVLGAWANGEGCHYGGIIEFYPNATRQGTVMMVGLAAYQWIYNNAGFGWDNIQVITRSALKYLENLNTAAEPYEVAYLLPSSIPSLAGWYDGEQPEHNAAVWFRDTYVNTGKKGCFVSIEELPNLYEKGVHTLWVNIERVGISPEEGLFEAYKDNLKAYIQAGGNVLLTKQATYLTYLMDRIGYAPVFQSSDYTTEDRGQVRSIQTVMGLSDCVAEDEHLDMSGHHIYNNMLSYWETKSMFFVSPGCRKTYDYCSWQDFFRANDEDTHYDNCLIQRLRDFEADWNATVLAVQGGIGDYCFSNIVEFNAVNEWQGRILTIGSAAYQWGSSNNSVERDNLKTLTANCLDHLMGKPVVQQTYSRPVLAESYGTICFDYAVSADQISSAQMYKIHSFDVTGDSVILTPVSQMEPGMPYIYYATASVIQLHYTGMKEEAKRLNGLIGFIGWSEMDTREMEEGYYVLQENALHCVSADETILLHHRYAYVDTAEIPAYEEIPQTEYRKIAISKTTPSDVEAVDEVLKDNIRRGTYDLLGRKVLTPQVPGIYIINGQKTLVTIP